MVEAAVLDDFTAGDWVDGMHHVVSYGIGWPAIAGYACSAAIHAGSCGHIVWLFSFLL